jgi:uncharacterized membrane protein
MRRKPRYRIHGRRVIACESISSQRGPTSSVPFLVRTPVRLVAGGRMVLTRHSKQRFSYSSRRPTTTSSDSMVRQFIYDYIARLRLQYSAYQSALLTTPLLLLRILASVLRLSPVLRTLLTVLLVISIGFMAYVLPRILFNFALIMRTRFQAHTGASRNGLSRFHVPFIGPLAERWLDEE